MGVMSCSRNNCDNIMCHTHIYTVGYICWECQQEFKDYLTSQNIEANTDGKIRKELKKFMETEKGEFIIGKETNVDEFFNENTQ